MNIRDNLNETVHLDAREHTWAPSPLAGVERVMLDRVGDEVAVATSIVRYAPNAHFDAHQHELGEEFVVLAGVFSDERGDYGPGTYVRNPPGTSHTPYSDAGCVIFVKLRQFDDNDLTGMSAQIPLHIRLQLRLQTDDSLAERGFAEGALAEEKSVAQVLYTYQDEVVSYVHVPAGERFAFASSYYVRELLILSGELTWQQEQTRTLGAWSWIRMAPGHPLRINATRDCVLLSKTRPVYRPAVA